LKYITVLFAFCFTALFAYDYFPNISQVARVPKSVFIFLVIGLFILSMLFNRKRSVESKEVLKWKVLTTAYILLLMGVFTILGGESSTGISFSNGVFWIVLLISLFEIISHWKKVKGSQSVSS
jgi:L-asparagine transporter-like permease